LASFLLLASLLLLGFFLDDLLDDPL